MRIRQLQTQPDHMLFVVADDDRRGTFDVRPYLGDEAFEPLQQESEFAKVTNGGYFVEWDCGADLSADTIEAGWHLRTATSRRCMTAGGAE